MEEKFYPKDCNDNDVVSFGDYTYKIGILKQRLNQSFDNNLGYRLDQKLNENRIRIPDEIIKPPNIDEPYARLFNSGIDCEILNLGSDKWKKGKFRVKITVEFYVESEEIEEISNNNNSEQPESEVSPLDDLRQKFNQENQ
ncbi:MAG: KGK family protein [Okeania sp. SIO2F4]|uniref:KGK domain-containing protein n=1 Tax=Okeania sp. SIO2F4 TaxID=2607790 RepID=UPI001428E719|nr:KGK domain-containing protein [Okeania sp. SIO2F4]NES04448.1 KGK family protein [Okeania sp. SIO2F4]